ncbi:hypothetical protein HPB51_014773 [Rhipicephalus microplus]|uniref:Membrane glycoprotein lig-1 n=1 Tax=Rhipicephalus microplus TaxID=6941 RepID=A0A9J6DNB7_RHIMP|nr:hypothetical protein HPB51_014773 [Rhipicephalus microplus]
MLGKDELRGELLLLPPCEGRGRPPPRLLSLLRTGCVSFTTARRRHLLGTSWPTSFGAVWQGEDSLGCKDFEPPSALALLIAIRLLALVHRAGSDDLVPDLCHLIDQPMYCRCDTGDEDEVAEVTCYVGRKLPMDHIVFQSFEQQPSVVSVAFTAFGSEYKLDFVPTLALLHMPQIERVKISQAELGDVKPHAFHNLSRIAVLSLDSNEITSLDADAIADLPRLKKLELADNKLRRLRAGSLKNLPSLTHLFLERNRLELVDDGAFEDLGALRELELSDNAIQKLSEQSFRGLERVARLDLFRNKLTRLEARVFSAMPQLAELDLKYNELSEVDPLAFEGLPQLTVLYMSYNRLRVLPAHMFRGAPNLVSVDLSQNQLLTLTLEDGPGPGEDRRRVLRHEPHR